MPEKAILNKCEQIGVNGSRGCHVLKHLDASRNQRHVINDGRQGANDRGHEHRLMQILVHALGQFGQNAHLRKRRHCHEDAQEEKNGGHINGVQSR